MIREFQPSMFGDVRPEVPIYGVPLEEALGPPKMRALLTKKDAQSEGLRVGTSY